VPLLTVDRHLTQGDLAAALRHDVRVGLTARRKELPPKYFYDAAGSELFERITRLPEYYPTRRERAILAARAAEVAVLTGADTLVELGSGSSAKTRLLLDALSATGHLRRYVPVDVSEPALLAAADQVAAALAGEPVGTVFLPTGARTASRLLWLRHATAPRGRLHLDPGAVRAVVDRRLSLLPAGVTGADGDFRAGDPVDLLDENGHVVARGLVNFDAREMPGLLGRSTRDLARELGPAYEREVVHRDDLVVLRR